MRVMELVNADGQDDCARCSHTRWVTRWVNLETTSYNAKTLVPGRYHTSTRKYIKTLAIFAQNITHKIIMPLPEIFA